MNTRRTYQTGRNHVVATIALALGIACGDLCSTIASDVRFSSTNYRQPFGLGEIKVGIIRGTNLESRLEVQFRTLDGTARAGEHYVAQTNPITFLPAETNAEIVIPLILSIGGNGDRTFTAQVTDSLSSPSWQTEASITLVDTLRPGGIDPTFDAGAILFASPGDYYGWSAVEDFEILPDGFVLIAGHFGSVQGELRKGLARLLPSGKLDSAFSNSWSNYWAPRVIDIHSMFILPDGAVIVGEGLQVIKVSNDGSVGVPLLHVLNFMAIQNDGRFFGRLYENPQGSAFTGVRRFLPNGELDVDFNTIEESATNHWTIRQVFVQADGRILVSYRGSELRRFNRDGTPDQTFNNVSSTRNIDAWGNTREIDVFVQQPDGKVLIGGNIVDINNVGTPTLVRLNSDGTVDSSFDASELFTWTRDGLWPRVRSVAVQHDEKLLVAGDFQNLDLRIRGGLVRLNSDGSHDRTFDVGQGVGISPNSEGLSPCCWINKVAIQSNGQILASGGFGSFNGFGPSWIVRLHGDTELRFGPAIVADDGRLRLRLSGASGQRVRLQRSTNLKDWEDWQILALGGATVELFDEAAAPQRFYRAIEAPSNP